MLALSAARTGHEPAATHTAAQEKTAPPPSRAELQVGPARTFAELCEAYALVYASYVSRGYCDPHPSRMRYGLHNCLPEAATFVGKHQGRVAATVSVIPDSPLGLPLDDIYSGHVEELRGCGRRLAEVVLLSAPDEVTGMRRSMASLLQVFKFAFDYARCLGIDDLMVTCSATRHEGFYTRYLQFERFGPHLPFDSVNGQLTTLLRLNLRCVESVNCPHKQVQAFFLDNPVPEEVFSQRFRHTESTLRHLFTCARRLLQDASDQEKCYIASRYPGIDIAALLSNPAPSCASPKFEAAWA